MSVETVTLGCRLNFAESETLARMAPAGEDWTIVNSCAVTNEAVRQSRQAVRRAQRQRPGAKILVTGCAAELEPQAFREMAGVERWADSSVVIRARFKVAPLQQWAVKREYLRRLKQAFDAAGIEIPFPQVMLHRPARALPVDHSLPAQPPG